MLLYDRFDIWELDPTGAKPAVVVTDSVGRRESLTFRIVDLDDDEDRAIDPAKPLMIRAFSELTQGQRVLSRPDWMRKWRQKRSCLPT